MEVKIQFNALVIIVAWGSSVLKVGGFFQLNQHTASVLGVQEHHGVAVCTYIRGGGGSCAYVQRVQNGILITCAIYIHLFNYTILSYTPTYIYICMYTWNYPYIKCSEIPTAVGILTDIYAYTYLYKVPHTDFGLVRQ